MFAIHNPIANAQYRFMSAIFLMNSCKPGMQPIHVIHSQHEICLVKSFTTKKPRHCLCRAIGFLFHTQNNS